MSEPNKSRLLAQLLITGMLFVTVAAVALIGMWVGTHRRPSGRVNVALQNSLIGIWLAENGAVLEFRADGSATSRFKTAPSEPQQLMWTVSGNELSIFTSTQNRIDRFLLNRPVATVEIVEIAPDRLELVDRSRAAKAISLRYKKVEGTEPRIPGGQ